MALEFTGDTVVDVVANNAVINAMLCTTSVHMMVRYERVSDSLGGICGKQSLLVSNSARRLKGTSSSLESNIKKV